MSFMGPLISIFWAFGDVSSGSDQSGQPCSHLAEAYAM